MTKKEAGISVYDLRGHEIQNIAPPPRQHPDDSPGRFNNVDILRGFELAGRRVDIAVTTDRGHDTIRFYAIDPRAAASQMPPLTDVTDPAVPFVFSADQGEVTAPNIPMVQPSPARRSDRAFRTDSSSPMTERG